MGVKTMAAKLGKTAMIIICAAALVMILLAVAWQSGMDPDTPAALTGSMAEATASLAVPLQLGRCGLWALLWWRWEWVGRRWFRAGAGTESAQAWRQSRPGVIATLALVEGMIVLRQLW